MQSTSSSTTYRRPFLASHDSSSSSSTAHDAPPDEEEQDRIISTLASTDLTTNRRYRLALLTLTGIIFLWHLVIFSWGHTSLQPLFSLGSAALILYDIPVTHAGRGEILELISRAPGWMLEVRSIEKIETGWAYALPLIGTFNVLACAYGWWGMGMEATEAAVGVLVPTVGLYARYELRGLDLEALRGARFAYKGA